MNTDRDCHLDLSGLHCPAPLIRCLATLQRLPNGACLWVTVSNRDALNDIALLLRCGPYPLLDWQQDANGRCHFQIHKNGPTPARPRRAHSWLELLLQHLAGTSTLPSVG